MQTVGFANAMIETLADGAAFRSKEERHRLALKKLARLFKGNNAPSSRDDASRAEAEVLREVGTRFALHHLMA